MPFFTTKGTKITQCLTTESTEFAEERSSPSSPCRGAFRPPRDGGIPFFITKARRGGLQAPRERRVIVRTVCMSVAVCLSIGVAAARAGGADEAKVREALKTQVEKYLATTREDLKSNPRYPSLTVDAESTSMQPCDSLVTPFTAEVRYSLEYDDRGNKGARLVHPFVMKCTWFAGRWDIDPHGHRDMKNVTDLDPKRSKILFPNI
jgi:hypothetical protein